MSRIAFASSWGCVGMFDASSHGPVDIVLVDSTNIVVLRPDGGVRNIPLPYALRSMPLGCEAADVDGDGRPELVVADSFGGYVVSFGADGTPGELKRLPTLPASDDKGLAWSFAMAAFDVEGDGDVDLYIARNFSGSADTFIFDGCRRTGGDILCGAPEKDYPGVPDLLLTNDGTGQFTLSEVETVAVPLQSQAVLAIDLDRDGRQDLLVAEDAMSNRFLRSVGDGTLEDRSEGSGLGAVRNHGMGIVAGDVDADGREELFFADIGAPLGLTWDGTRFDPAPYADAFGAARLWTWGIALEDFDNDGDLDLLLQNMGTIAELSQFCPGCGLEELPMGELVLYRNDGTGRFTPEIPLPAPDAGFGAENVPFIGGRTMATGDWDGDGLLDAVMVRRATDQSLNTAEVLLLRGRMKAATTHLGVSAPQGTRITICRDDADCLTREVTGGGSGPGAARARHWHLGLAGAAQADVTVAWPDGRRAVRRAVPTGTHLTIETPDGG